MVFQIDFDLQNLGNGTDQGPNRTFCRCQRMLQVMYTVSPIALLNLDHLNKRESSSHLTYSDVDTGDIEWVVFRCRCCQYSL